ncbi:MAG TPA: methionine--tRNA ligase [Clostridiales bacterium]|nr:methionine--tRNA ligase [Clostridiales bacterium]
MKEKYYITTAIAYTSSKPHIGNTYEAILADSIARFKRNQGYDVFFQTGTDEHGQKIEEKAKAAGKTPKEYVDIVAGEIKEVWDKMNVSYDKFIRTTDAYHEKQVQKIFRKFYEQGDIYKGSYSGWYFPPCESFYTDSQLVGGKCPDCGREVKKAQEEAYFFKMSKYAPKLIDYINSHPDFIAPVSRKNEMMNNFLLAGLQDLCVSRTSFKWGIPVDFDDKHVVYVWVDALSNYITGIGYDADGNHSDAYKKYWPADIHVIGKDIIRFHTIYWPIFLMALGEPLPKRIFGHPWLLQDGGKMSKSKGNVLYADDLAEVFGVDAVRYFVLSCMPFDNDGLISRELMVDKINGDLANVYGNLVKRTIAMSNKYFGGVVGRGGAEERVDEELKNCVTSLYPKVSEYMDENRISDAIDEIFSVLRRANKYIDETMPWALAKDESKSARLKEVLYNLTETIVITTSLLEPFIPTAAAKVLSDLGTEMRNYAELGKFGLYPDGNKVTDNPDTLFIRLDAEEVEKKFAENEKTEEKNEREENEITIDDFAKIQFRTALVKACEKIEKSKKLLKLSLKIGDEERTVVSGIAEYYKPEEMVGKKVVVVYNLKAAKLCGVESKGMILCAEKDGKVVVVSPEDGTLPDGATVR